MRTSGYGPALTVARSLHSLANKLMIFKVWCEISNFLHWYLIFIFIYWTGPNTCCHIGNALKLTGCDWQYFPISPVFRVVGLLHPPPPGYTSVYCTRTHYYGIHTWAVHNLYIIHWISQNIAHLIGCIYARACGTCVNTKPTDSWYSPVLNE